MANAPGRLTCMHVNTGSYINIPADDDNLGNIFEHSANTGVGLAGNGTVYMVTFDGNDSCLFDPRCGINAFSMAYFFKDYLGVASAFGMDQVCAHVWSVCAHV